jgi:hypothetical protein
MKDDIVDDLIAFNYAMTGKISLAPCAPDEECPVCGSILVDNECGTLVCLDSDVADYDDDNMDDESDDYLR